MNSDFRNVVLLSLAGLTIGPITGLIPGMICAAQQPEPYRLTLQDAIQKALQANLNVLVAGTRVDEAEGARAPLVGRAASAHQHPELRQRAEPRPARLWNFGAWFA